MIIAIATDGGHVSPHFGRCEAYTLLDIQNANIVKKEQMANPGHAPGAIPEFLNRKGANKIVCGGIGARATQLFAHYGIEIVAGIEGAVDEVIEKLVDGTLVGKEAKCRPGAGRGYGVEKTVCDHTHEQGEGG